jgi:energy-coupling factor transporter ATP-binding protein EcfA2
MKITFKNFKQHQDREFVFPDKGLVLLNGGSGNGKTTVLKGILQALYDSIKKPYTFGAKVCNVDLELGDLKIMRQKGPNRLIVNGKEDATAQDIIHTTLGMNEAEFMASSYIQQKMLSSLLTLSPADQLSFIEKLAFGANSPEKFKSGINDLVLTRKKEVEGIAKKTTMLEEMIASQEKIIRELEVQLLPVEEIDPSLASETKERFVFYKDMREKAWGEIAILNTERNNPEYAVIDNLEKEWSQLISTQESQKQRIAALTSEISVAGVSWVPMTRSEAVDKIAVLRAYPEYCKITKDLERNKARLVEYRAQNEATAKEIDLELGKLYRETTVTETKEKLKKINELEAWIISRDKISAVSNPFAEKYPDCWKTQQLKGVKKFEVIRDYLENTIANTEQWIKTANLETIAVQEKLTILNQADKQLYCPECSAVLVLSNGELKKEKNLHIEAEKAEHKKTLQFITDAARINEAHLFEFKTDLNTVNQIIKDIKAFLPKPNDLAPSLEACQTLKTDTEVLLAELEELLNQKFDLINKLALINKDQLSKRIEEEIEIKYNEQQRILNSWPMFANVDFTKNIEIQDTEITYLENYISINDDKDSTLNSLRQQKDKEVKILFDSEDKRINVGSRLDVLHNSSGLRDRNEIDNDIKEQERQVSVGVMQMGLMTPTLELIAQIEKQKQQNHGVESKIQSLNTNIKTLSDQKTTVDIEVKTAEEKLEATIRLKQFSETAQMEAVASVVESINIAAKDFLDLLFPENPITVALLPYKTTKTDAVRAKFSTIIKYKGCEYNDIEEISGGEYDRIVLAYQLALNAIYNSPVLLLDEAFTAVEEELFLLAMDALKVIAQNKLIIVVSHGAITGIFDEVIDV